MYTAISSVSGPSALVSTDCSQFEPIAFCCGTIKACTSVSVSIFRYDNKGCGRSYLSQRDLDAHILYRHSKDKPLAPSLQPPGLKNPMASFQIFFQPGMVRPEFMPVRHNYALYKWDDGHARVCLTPTCT